MSLLWRCGSIDSGTQKMKCPYCGTEFALDVFAENDESLENTAVEDVQWASEGTEWQEGETQGLHSYVCNSCGGEIVGDENMAATACPFCGNPVVMMEKCPMHSTQCGS